MNKRDVLASVTFGQRVAEDEADSLETYFVETDHWRRLYAGEVDIVYGPKGSGKSALYSLLIARTTQLFDRSTVLAAAENPRGAPAFRDLVIDPPASEVEFVGLWKLYFASILAGLFEEIGVGGSKAGRLREALAREGLVPSGRPLQTLLRNVFEYVKAALRPDALEGEVKIDSATGLPTGFKGRITFREPNAEAAQHGVTSVDHLLALADTALSENSNFSVWILLDRLDVAFAESQDLEQNALRALFRVYLDILGFRNIRLKIFLRTDIWNRITTSGFREASHITRAMTIDWNRTSLLNLIVRRAIRNDALRSFYGQSTEQVLRSSSAQELFLYRICPDQIDVGPNKPRTLDWILSRTRDGTGQSAPREVIHLLNAARDVQIRRLEIGEPEPEGPYLFARTTFKEALSQVSRVRLEQTLYAEYPSLKPFLENLRGAKTKHTIDTLVSAWSVEGGQAKEIAQELINAGFFEARGDRDLPEFWVPFLYRDGLEMIQGTADVDGDAA